MYKWIQAMLETTPGFKIWNYNKNQIRRRINSKNREEREIRYRTVTKWDKSTLK